MYMLGVLTKHNIELKKFFGSFLVSMLIVSQCLFGISEFLIGTTMPIKILLIAGALLGFFCFDKKFTIKHFGVFFIIFSFFLLTFLVNNNTSLEDLFVSFIIYGCGAFIFSFCEIDEVSVFRFCVFFGFAWLFLFLIKNHFDVSNTFTFGYTLLPAVIASYLLLISKRDRIIIFIIRLVLFLGLSFFLITSGSRGPVFCFIFFLFIHYLPCVKNWKKAIVYVSILIVFIVLLVNITAIVTFIHDSIPGKISFIEKTYNLLTRSEGVSNGRFEIIAEIFSEYKFTDFIFGIGIGSYNSTHLEEGYTHNLILSVVLDFGVIGLVFIALIACLFFIHLFTEKKNNNYFELLFAVSFVSLFFSGNYWKYFTFWLLAFLMINASDYMFVSDEVDNQLSSGALRSSNA